MLEVVECRARRIDDIAAAVVPPILFEAEASRGAGNHLPQACRAAVRIGERIVGALDNRQQCEFERQTTPVQLRRDVRQVALGAREDAVQVIRMLDKPVALRANAAAVLVLEYESIAQTGQQIVSCRCCGRLGLPEALQRRYQRQCRLLIIGRRCQAFKGRRVGRGHAKRPQKGDGRGRRAAQSLR